MGRGGGRGSVNKRLTVGAESAVGRPRRGRAGDSLADTENVN